MWRDGKVKKGGCACLPQAGEPALSGAFFFWAAWYELSKSDGKKAFLVPCLPDSYRVYISSDIVNLEELYAVPLELDDRIA